MMINSTIITNSSGIYIQYFIAPIVTATVIARQYFLLPKLEREKTKEVELWKNKKDTFIKAINLIDEKYETLNFGDGMSSVFNKEQEVNKIYTELLLFSKDAEIPEMFWKFFDSKTAILSAQDRGKFISILRKDLGHGEVDPTKIPVFHHHIKYR